MRPGKPKKEPTARKFLCFLYEVYLGKRAKPILDRHTPERRILFSRGSAVDNVSVLAQQVIAMDRRKRLLGKVRGPGDRRVARHDRRRHWSVFRIVFIPFERLVKHWPSVTLF